MIISHYAGVYFCAVSGIGTVGTSYQQAIERAMTQLIIRQALSK